MWQILQFLSFTIVAAHKAQVQQRLNPENGQPLSVTEFLQGTGKIGQRVATRAVSNETSDEGGTIIPTENTTNVIPLALPDVFNSSAPTACADLVLPDKVIFKTNGVSYVKILGRQIEFDRAGSWITPDGIFLYDWYNHIATATPKAVFLYDAERNIQADANVYKEDPTEGTTLFGISDCNGDLVYRLETYGKDLDNVGITLLDKNNESLVVMKTVQNNNSFDVLAGDGMKVATMTGADEYHKIIGGSSGDKRFFQISLKIFILFIHFIVNF